MATVSWYDSDEDYEEDIYTSVTCKCEEVNNVLDAMDIHRRSKR